MAADLERITIRPPDDMHVHLRQGRPMRRYARRISGSFARGVVMPNLIPPVSTEAGLIDYRNKIRKAAPGFEPLVTFKLSPGIAPGQVAALKNSGAVAGKYYPEGVTTNSEDGIRSADEVYPILEAMEGHGIVLCIHGEDPSAPVLEREGVFLSQLEELVRRFPRLNIVLEHVSTREAVKLVDSLPSTVAATVTVHHLLFTLEDMMASGFYPALYCKPVVKGAPDREAIQRTVLEGNPKFFFGSDSAPHPVSAKRNPPVAAGVYSSPVAMPLIIDFFDSHGALDKLEDFVSRFGAEFYSLPLNEGESVWFKESWTVPGVVDGAVPLCAGETLLWKKSRRF
ncbi:MAG: dihydroorotase [Spirochaetales bacterium]|nr:dihydroorotase [Spirochaetales bacterium]